MKRETSWRQERGGLQGWRPHGRILAREKEARLFSRRRIDSGQQADSRRDADAAADWRRKRPRRVWEAATAAAAADASAAAAAKEEWLNQYSIYTLFAAMDEREQRMRRDALVLSTRDWIKRAKASLSGVREQRCCRLGRQKAEGPKEQRCCRLGRQKAEGPKEEPSMSNVDFLPFHLVFSRLPLRQLFQLRCVCKHWNLMLRGAALALLDSNTEQEEYWFVMSRPLPNDERIWDFRAFSSQDWAFFGLPLPGCSQGKLSKLLGGMGCSLLPQLEGRNYVGRCLPRLVSAGGLMCAFVHKPDSLDDYSVIVFNCLTGSVKVLPPLQDPHYLSRHPAMTSLGCYMHMAVDDQDPARYYILLTHEEYEFYFEVFDSRRGCWRVGQNPKAAIADSKVPNADFFFNSIDTVLGYNVSDDVWSKVSVGPIYNEAPAFLKYRGRLLKGLCLVGRDAICVGFVVRELRPTASEVATWVEVARTPQHLLEGVSREDWHLKIRAEGSLFYMVFEDNELQGQFRPPLVYDIDQNLWYFLPSERGSTNFGCISVLRPRLSTRLLHI